MSNKIKTKENILVIGDIHGRDIWKEIVAREESKVDKIIFIGDYFDTPVVSPEKIRKNFAEILAYKNKNKNKVVLLTGNHDFHYMYPELGKCSGFDDENAFINKFLLKDVLDLKLAYTSGNLLFTHAGVSSSWLHLATRDLVLEEKERSLEETLNTLFYNKPSLFSFWKFDNSGYGEHPCQSPLWIRPKSLAGELVMGWVQVVGHTVMKSGIQNIENDLILVDALSEKQYMTIIKNKVIINSIL